jgi:hypothetical protein
MASIASEGSVSCVATGEADGATVGRALGANVAGGGLLQLASMSASTPPSSQALDRSEIRLTG